MILIKAFGKFKVINENIIITEDDIVSSQIIKLLICLALNRDKKSDNERLIADMWDDSKLDDPMGALKNLVYRLRKTISEKIGVDFVKRNKNGYMWNNEVEVKFDFEMFDTYIIKALNESNDDIKYTFLEKAVELFNGDFLRGVKDGQWVSILKGYYHKMYVWAVKSLVKYYKQLQDIEKIEQICLKAVGIELFDEQLYCDLIRARIRLDKPIEAMYLFDNAKKRMEKQLGEGNAKLLNKVYDEIVEMNDGKNSDSLRQIRRDIAEAETQGAFLCKYNLFKEICNLQIRKSKRSDEQHNLILLTVQIEKDIPENTRMIRLEKSMYGLENTICDCLRAGDVVAKYSDTQYVLLLSQCTKQETENVIKRITQNFYESFKMLWKLNVKVEIDAINNEP